MKFPVYIKTVYGCDIFVKDYDDYSEAMKYVDEMNEIIEDGCDSEITGVKNYFIKEN